MFKTIMALSALTLSFQAYSITTKEFTDNLMIRLQDNIDSKRAENSNYCKSFKKSDIYSELSYADETGTKLRYYNIQNLEVSDFFKLVKHNFNCYDKKAPNQDGSILGDIFNTGSHNQDRELIRDALKSLAVEDYEFYKTMGEVFDLGNR
jgi:hypothetical protein